MITKERIKEIYVNNYNVGGEPSSPEMDALCKLALKGLATEKLEKACEFYGDRKTYSRLQDSRDLEYVVLWGDSTEQNDSCHYAGLKARTALEEYRKECES